MREQVRTWAHGLAATFVTGAASSITAWAGSAAAQAVGWNIQALTIRQVLVTAIFSGAVGAAAYLKQSPLPPE